MTVPLEPALTSSWSNRNLPHLNNKKNFVVSSDDVSKIIVEAAIPKRQSIEYQNLDQL